MRKRIISSLLLVFVLLSGLVVYGEKPDVDRKVLDRERIQRTYKLGQGEKAPKIDLDFELLSPGVRVMAKDQDYIYGVSGNNQDGYGRVIYRSSDLGENWYRLKAFKKKVEGIHISENGVILVSTSNGRWKQDAECEIYRSQNFKDFKKVLDLKDGAAINWNITSDGEGSIYISEYGYKKAPNNARKIYASRDDGKTWKVVYNPKPRQSHHNHILEVDKYDNNIIYQSIGDVQKEIIVSRDKGRTWEQMISGYNPTSILQLEDDILFGLDNHPQSGIIRYNKKTKKLDYSLKTPAPLSGSIYDLLYDEKNDKIYAGLLSYSQIDHTWDGSIFMSSNKGESWEKIVHWPKLDENSGIGFYKMIEKDGYGFIDCQLPLMVANKKGHYTGTMKFKLK